MGVSNFSEEEMLKILKSFTDIKLEKDKLEIERGSYKLDPYYCNDLRLAIEQIIDLYSKNKKELSDIKEYQNRHYHFEFKPSIKGGWIK